MCIANAAGVWYILFGAQEPGHRAKGT